MKNPLNVYVEYDDILQTKIDENPLNVKRFSKDDEIFLLYSENINQFFNDNDYNFHFLPQPE